MARQRTLKTFIDGLIFGVGVSVLALLHGGMLSMGPQYGGGGFTTMRREFGYAAGGLLGFLHWNIAGFGLPLVLAVAALCLHYRRRDPKATERDILFTALAVFGVFSYLVPQIVFYSSETYGVEQYTEISKFFFCAHFALALLSAFGLAYMRSIRRWWIMAPCFLAAAVSPVLFCYANSIDDKGAWLGLYHSPYYPHSIEEQAGDALSRLKKTNHDVYFDASADERHHGYLSEMLLFGGSAFTLTPSAYERTGIGYRLSQDVVGRRFAQNSRMARLLPGAAEEAGCTWYYCRSLKDLGVAPVIVRSRFAKLIAEGAFALKFSGGERALYAIEKPTADLDRDIERHWAPQVVAQTRSDCSGKGRNELIFFDYVDKKILCGKTAIDLPDWLRGEFVNLYVARFPGTSKSDFLIGRMEDTYFRLGKRIEENAEHNFWGWTSRDPKSGQWRPEFNQWSWDWEIPIVADIDHSGFASQIAYRYRTGEWVLAPDKPLPGPSVDKALIPVPFAGRFFEGSQGDLGIWSLMNGMVTVKSITTGQSVSFRWGGTYGFILVPGDYDGIGRDQLAIFNQGDLTWVLAKLTGRGSSLRRLSGRRPASPFPGITTTTGRVDLAYWEPREGKIYVSFDHGRSVGLIVTVPPHSIPAYVNMYWSPGRAGQGRQSCPEILKSTAPRLFRACWFSGARLRTSSN